MNLGIMRFSTGYENDWIGLIEIGLMHWLFLRNKYGTCGSHFKNFESQLRSSCFFLMKSLYNSYTMENHLTRFPQFWISFLIWINFRHYFLLNFSNQSKAPVNTIFVTSENHVYWCFRLIEEVE